MCECVCTAIDQDCSSQIFRSSNFCKRVAMGQFRFNMSEIQGDIETLPFNVLRSKRRRITNSAPLPDNRLGV